MRVGDKKAMDQCLGKAATQWGMEWDRNKDWCNGVHLGVNLDKRKHQKYRTQKARAMWNMVKRLTRLPPKEKAQLVVSQIILILTYGAELHDIPWEGGRLLGEITRWVPGAWRGGSSRERVAELAGIEELETQVLVKKLRWAASVYARDLPILRKRAEKIQRKLNVT